MLESLQVEVMFEELDVAPVKFFQHPSQTSESLNSTRNRTRKAEARYLQFTDSVSIGMDRFPDQSLEIGSDDPLRNETALDKQNIDLQPEELKLQDPAVITCTTADTQQVQCSSINEFVMASL